MSKNVIVNGESYNSISTVALALATGGTALFRDVDEASGGVDGIVEIAAGSFTVDSAETTHTIKHGMSVAPDVVVAIPKYWFDTLDANFCIAATSAYANAASGRRSVAEGTTHFTGSIGDGSDRITDTEVLFVASVYGKFQPTYTDADGNTGTQVYLWVAVKFAE